MTTAISSSVTPLAAETTAAVGTAFQGPDNCDIVRIKPPGSACRNGIHEKEIKEALKCWPSKNFLIRIEGLGYKSCTNQHSLTMHRQIYVSFKDKTPLDLAREDKCKLSQQTCLPRQGTVREIKCTTRNRRNDGRSRSRSMHKLVCHFCVSG